LASTKLECQDVHEFIWLPTWTGVELLLTR